MKQTELLALIQQAKAEQWTALDLRGQKLKELPPTIGELTQLEVLNLGYLQDPFRRNYLSALPDWVAQLTNLNILDLSGNLLSKLPDWMMRLTNLNVLDLRSNNLSELPDWIAQFTKLRILDLRYNRLNQVPDSMAQLTNLHELYLSDNNLSQFPEWTAQLAKLRTLDLSFNGLSQLPDWMADPEMLPRLGSLYIGDNPLTIPPVEVLGKSLNESYTKVDIAAIRNYFRQLQEETDIYFYEAKLLIIGEGGAGKTSLARKLVETGCELLPDEGSTQGVDILHWSFPLSPDQPGKATDYTVNIWDFGGQEIYFATHQFFLTRRSVYVLVADTRRQHTDFYTWLRMQETFGDESPVLLLKNYNRHAGNTFTIQNLPQLRERFPNLKEVIEVDLDKVPEPASWADLCRHLEDYLLNLDHIGQPRPRTWVDVRKAVDADERDTLAWSQFDDLCRGQGMKRGEDILQLADYLHNLGDILYFRDDPILCDLVILKPTWGLDAVYKVLDNQAIIDRMGQFDLTDLRALWSEARYKGFQQELRRLMENFQLCYPLAGVPDTYIAPQLLTVEAPDYEWDLAENLQMRYYYPLFMPRGILSRAIVKLHQRIETQNLVWRSGVILNDGDARAELLEIWGERQIRIRVSGYHKRDLLMEIVRALDELHQNLGKLRFERQIPCNCATCRHRNEPHFYDFASLRKRLAGPNAKRTIECQLEPYEDVSIWHLLDEIDLDGLWPDRRGQRERQVQINIDQGDRTQVGNIDGAQGVAIGPGASVEVGYK